MQLLSYVKDEVERASYETKVAERLGVEVSILREKGARLERKLAESSAKKYRKKPQTTVIPDHLRKMADSLLALKLFGGELKTDIPLPVPDDETRINELELIFTQEHEGLKNPNYEKEAAELLKRYLLELNKQKISELTAKLADLDDNSPEYESVIREISNLQKSQK